MLDVKYHLIELQIVATTSEDRVCQAKARQLQVYKDDHADSLPPFPLAKRPNYLGDQVDCEYFDTTHQLHPRKQWRLMVAATLQLHDALVTLRLNLELFLLPQPNEPIVVTVLLGPSF